ALALGFAQDRELALVVSPSVQTAAGHSRARQRACGPGKVPGGGGPAAGARHGSLRAPAHSWQSRAPAGTDRRAAVPGRAGRAPVQPAATARRAWTAQE